MGYAYGYDQLNRLVSMDAWVNFNTGTYAWQTSGSASSKLQERVTYDANGNITKYLRKGYSPTNMDSLTYKYYPKSNKLKRVDDAISDGTYTDIDVDDQDNNNYDYDLTGNLVKDSIEGISLITWNLMGKVDSIARYGSSSRPELKFLYDAMGNRVGKVVYDGSDVSKTWYIRDAQGNIMATYEEENDTLTWAEQHIYGSSRLGYWQPDSMMFPKPALPATDTFRYKVKAGDKLYEIANHLGNVLATITDRKIPKETGTPNGIADYYVADIATVQDYYPFGMVMPGRNWTAATATGYGFGFNGQQQNDEVYGKGNLNTAEFWEYDTRLGRRWNTDPIKVPFESPFSVFRGNPILLGDPNGDFPNEMNSNLEPGPASAPKNNDLKLQYKVIRAFNPWWYGEKGKSKMQRFFCDCKISCNIYARDKKPIGLDFSIVTTTKYKVTTSEATTASQAPTNTAASVQTITLDPNVNYKIVYNNRQAPDQIVVTDAAGNVITNTGYVAGTDEIPITGQTSITISVTPGSDQPTWYSYTVFAMPKEVERRQVKKLFGFIPFSYKKDSVGYNASNSYEKRNKKTTKSIKIRD